MTTFYSNGKLLLTAEYVVLDDALALALPSKFGQSLSIESIDEKHCIWESYDADGSLWFKAFFTLPDLDFLVDEPSSLNDNIAAVLKYILREARELNPLFLSDNQNIKITTKLNFSRFWGLGSSSTLINNIARWAQVDAFGLQFKCFGGSAYDIACAQNNSPILYRLKNQKPLVKSVDFNPSFKDQLYFVYLNKKQSTSDGINYYLNLDGDVKKTVLEVSKISKKIAVCNDLTDFELLISNHEKIIGKLIKTKPIKERLFSDYFGEVKSLGAWGGDFILATGNTDTLKYFKKKGFKTVIPYNEMIL